MSFQQYKLDRSFNQTRGIFDKYIYRPDNGDLRADVVSPNYFADSRFADEPDWTSGILEIDLPDAFLVGKVSPDGTLNILLDSTTEPAQQGDAPSGEAYDPLVVDVVTPQSNLTIDHDFPYYPNLIFSDADGNFGSVSYSHNSPTQVHVFSLTPITGTITLK